jgi:HAD superfamily hydrolase (TIGR01549 family)
VNQLNYNDALAGKSLLLLDFDGPVCSVFAGYPAHQIAAELVAEMRKADADLAASLNGETDPMEVVRIAASSTSPGLVDHIDRQLREAELLAVESATLTAGIVELIESAQDQGLQIGIVSNNSRDAILKYLKRSRLAQHLAFVIGRPIGKPGLMKPEPFLLLQALAQAGSDPSRACFIGDSVSDIVAGRAAKVMTIGYANKPGKEDRLHEAGADLVVTHL